MAVLTDDELMPWWVTAGLEQHPGEGEPLDLQVPGWLLDAPGLREEPGCECCGVAHDPDAGPRAVRSAEPEEPVRWAIPGVWGDEPVPVVPSVGELVGQLVSVTAQLAAVDPTSLSPDLALGEAQAMAGVQHQLRVQQLGRTQDVKARELHVHLGYRSLAAWQRTTAPDAPSADRTLSRRLPTHPALAQALTDRIVSFAAAAKVGTALSTIRLHLDGADGLIDGLPGEQVVEACVRNVLDLICRDRFGLSEDWQVDPAQADLLGALEEHAAGILAAGGSQAERVEKAMVLLAEHITPASLTGALEQLVLAVLPLTLEEREKTAQDKRTLRLRPNGDGTWDLSATLTPEAGEQLHTALAAEARRDPANPLDTHAREQTRQQAGLDAEADRPGWEARALNDYGEAMVPDGEQLVPRSRSKRLHDAFGRLLTRYLQEGLGGLSGKVPVQVTVTTCSQTIEGAPGALPAKGASGRPLARSLLRRWWCDAHITTLLMSRGYKPLGVVHSGRTITGTELKAVRAQYDNRCPGIDCCPATPDPLIPLVPHHVIRYAEGGRTSIDQTLLVCDRLHQDLHVGKRTIRLRNGSLITENGYLTHS